VAKLGGRVAIIEKHHFGGDCLNTGCVPSKCLIRCAQAAAEAREAAQYGVVLPEGEISVDFEKVHFFVISYFDRNVRNILILMSSYRCCSLEKIILDAMG
jgi:pyruvate/2-oxoglutarate dehydrogenase complex dihydrolipoamide dehydrogenase (E3) component